MSKCAYCNELVGEEWSANNGLCSTCARDEVSEAGINQPDHIVDINEMAVDNSQENKTSEIVQVDEGDVNSFENQASEDELDTILKQHREWMRGIKTDHLTGTSHAETKAAIIDWHIKQIEAVLDRLDKETERCQDGCWVSIKAERNKLKERNNTAKVDMNLDDLIDKFKAYCQGEGDYDELDFKSDLIDWCKVEK